MDELMLEMVKKITDQLENFLKACKSEGDCTIDDVLDTYTLTHSNGDGDNTITFNVSAKSGTASGAAFYLSP